MLCLCCFITLFILFTIYFILLKSFNEFLKKSILGKYHQVFKSATLSLFIKEFGVVEELPTLPPTFIKKCVYFVEYWYSSYFHTTKKFLHPSKYYILPAPYFHISLYLIFYIILTLFFLFIKLFSMIMKKIQKSPILFLG